MRDEPDRRPASPGKKWMWGETLAARTDTGTERRREDAGPRTIREQGSTKSRKTDEESEERKWTGRAGVPQVAAAGPTTMFVFVSAMGIERKGGEGGTRAGRWRRWRGRFGSGGPERRRTSANLQRTSTPAARRPGLPGCGAGPAPSTRPAARPAHAIGEGKSRYPLPLASNRTALAATRVQPRSGTATCGAKREAALSRFAFSPTGRCPPAHTVEEGLPTPSCQLFTCLAIRPASVSSLKARQMPNDEVKVQWGNLETAHLAE